MKKQSKDWSIAVIHWLIAGVAMQFVTDVFLGTLAVIIIGEDNVIPLIIVTHIILFSTIWLGVIYSAKYLTKTYIIENSNRIVKLATIYLGITGGILRLFKMVKEVELNSIIDFGFFAVVVAIFYILSKKYVKNTEEVALTQ